MTAEEKQDEVVVWKPKEFTGNDLLPYDYVGGIQEVKGVPLVVEDNIDPDDLVLPALALLHGTSTAVTDGVEGARPGLFMHTGTEEVLPEGSVRAIVVHYHKGNALFPKDDPRYEGIETCISPDGVEGTVYGFCKECRKCLWKDDGSQEEPPLGGAVHHFVVLTSMGPVMMRFTKSNYKAGSLFLSSKKISQKQFWAHPVVVRVTTGDKTLKSGKVTKFFKLQMKWQTTERVPDELQLAAYELYKSIQAKHETGNLKSNEDGTPDADFDV